MIFIRVVFIVGVFLASSGLTLLEASAENEKFVGGPVDAWFYLNKKFIDSVENKRYKEAEQIALESIEVAKKVELEGGTGKNYFLVSSYNNLAAIYQIQGKNGEAEVVYKKVLAITSLHNDDRENTLDNLGLLYIRQKKYNEAEQVFKQLLAEREKRLGGNDPKTVMAMCGLATSYLFQNKFTEAEGLLKQSLIISEKNKDDVATRDILESLLTVYKKMGNTKEMRSLEKRLKEFDFLEQGTQ
jgi:tetratricopeptide (TPR) repeat protein